jgi:hypothetical protein
VSHLEQTLLREKKSQKIQLHAVTLEDEALISLPHAHYEVAFLVSRDRHYISVARAKRIGKAVHSALLLSVMEALWRSDVRRKAVSECSERSIILNARCMSLARFL